DLRSTSDGGCIVAGYTSSSDGDVTEQSGPFDIWVVKLNALGVIEWQRSLGGSYSEMVPKVRVAAGGGYYVCTNTISHDGDVSDHHNQPDDWISDIWVVRLDEEGGTLWQRCLGGTGEDVPQGFVELPGGGCTILGMSNSNDGDVQGNNGGWDGWIVELASNGDLLWQRCLGSTTDYDHPLGLTRTMDGGYVHWACVMNGDGDVDPEQFHGRADAWVVKLEGDTHTGIEETRAPAFTIAPVPATHTVRITPDPSMGASHVTIHDAAGRTVHNGPVLGGSLVLDVQHWARGLYAVTLQDARGSSTQRLVLE
ncbi:MAG: T9SS type A sorting domain-containing protein, partial [Flavobacteriales bacterium]|nr:T9SS type A sorting domain-containing protein [Flavobacteriales bacterium]